VNYNNRPGNRIMGDTTECIAGQPYLIETLRSHLPHAPQRLKDGLRFRLSSTSFFQVNSAQAEVLLDQVLLAATNQTNENRDEARFEQRLQLVLDAYAGVGTMAMWMSELAERVIAIEEVTASIEDGEVNLGLNNIENVDFAHARVETEVPSLFEKLTKADVLIVDPPRKGIDAGGLNSIIELGPRRIVYVSCNPATLARDLKILQANGYDTKRVQPIDMFPQTYHVESVTLLEKIGSQTS
jgi:23S rRNA (uracil1939-C5)-methyltransferase